MTRPAQALNSASEKIDLGSLAQKDQYNLSAPELLELAVQRGEGKLSADGAFAAETGAHTGRSPKDKYTVRSPMTEHQIWWDANQEITPEKFDELLAFFLEQAEGKGLQCQQLLGGADEAHQLGVEVYCEQAWHALFIRHLLRRPSPAQLSSFQKGLTVIDLPSLEIDPARFGLRSSTVIACDFERRIILIGGTHYAGEIKKAVFSFLNYSLPEKGVLPMHCSANVGPKGDAAIFFGLSGTGKTTLSAEPDRDLVGDDEHGWAEGGIFNFEGGCYAKTIRLSQKNEPEIYRAARRFGSVLENVVLHEGTREPDFDDVSLTDNTRSAYPLEAIANALPSGQASHPKTIVMLTADAFGVLPPIAQLEPAQAIVHFLSGYTAKVAGTERGVIEPEATFSACFGAPFMPRHPNEYGELLRGMMQKHGATCWLLNTGWTGGPYGKGERMPLKATRALLNAALDGDFDKVSFREDPIFKIKVPESGPEGTQAYLDPRATWADGKAYDEQAQKLATMFRENFKKFEDRVTSSVMAALP